MTKDISKQTLGWLRAMLNVVGTNNPVGCQLLAEIERRGERP